MKAKRGFALHLVQDALTECGATPDNIADITAALTGAFDDEQAETLRQAETMLTGTLDQLR